LRVDLRPASIAEAVSCLPSNNDEREQTGGHLLEKRVTLQEVAARFEQVYERSAGG